MAGAIQPNAVGGAIFDLLFRNDTAMPGSPPRRCLKSPRQAPI